MTWFTQVDEIYAKIQLDTKHIGKGCDRDTYSVRSQRKLCNAGNNNNNGNSSLINFTIIASHVRREDTTLSEVWPNKERERDGNLYASFSEGALTTLLGVDQASPSGSKSGASRAPTQDRGNENSAIYFFDGKTNALLLPRDTFHQTDTMAVQFWMKHEQVRRHGRQSHRLYYDDGYLDDDQF